MKKLFLGFLLILLGCLFLQGQTVLTYEGQTYNNTDNPVGYGINVPRSVPTTFTFRNNSVTSINVQGYMLQAGDEGVSSTNGNLNGEVISGSKFNWNGDFAGLGTAMTITHGLFTGCNINVNIKHNYLARVPMGIIRKSASNMVNTSGGVSYNILKTFNVGGVVKGMSNVNWYNNTFYQDRPTYSGTDPTAGTWRGAIDIYTNTDVTPNSAATGTKVKNNIFYSKYKTLAIDVMDAASLTGFECDYNVYWVEEGDHTPVFNAGGSTKTWTEWRALGYDAHSVVMNPNFNNFTDFVPTARLNYGTDLGTAFNTGLATNATWTVGSAPATQVQNGTWQVGARIYAPTTTTITIEGQTVNDSNNPVDDNYAPVRIDNSVKAQLYYRNNSITSINQHGYMLDAGDESVLSTNNNLDGAVITGNKLTWNGTQTGSVITHGLFTGYNINDVIKYNYLTNVPYGIIIKSGSPTSNMINTTGGVSYNVVKNGRFAGRVKGINGTKFYNNTFYGDANSWYLILITSNADNGTPYPSINTKVKNNIFYTTTKTPSISVQSTSLTGFECDYNVYWCEAGDHNPIFTVEGVSKTWTEWKALGYDAHSIVVNPNFNNTTDFLPTSRLNYGTDLGTEFNTGLATTATWVVGTSPATQVQNGTWQVGSRVYAPVVANLPTVTTTAISSIGTTTANSGGNVTSDGGATVTERGVCWDMSGGPALDNPHTHDGTGTGTFTSIITGLSPNTLYYARAYATNSVGTGYGERVSFTTNPVTPTNYLYVSKTALTIPATANSDGKFNIISNTTWEVVSSQPWLTVGVELYYSLGTQGYKTQLYSGSAPDIGAYEYMQTNASGHDSAFVTLTAEANTGALRTATVTVSGTGVTSQVVNVTQEEVLNTKRVYYVSSTDGNDTNNGTSETTPWKTLDKVNGYTFSPGDKILFKRGDTFRGYLYIRNYNGTATNPITFDAYGTGNKPKIFGSKDYSSSTLWTVSSGNIWVTTNAVTTHTDVANLIFNNETAWGIKKTTLINCTAQGNWYINPSNSKVYLYSVSNPGTFYSHIEIGGAFIGSNIEEVIKVTANYITIRNFDVRYSPNNGIIFMYGCQHCICEYNDVSWIGGMYVSSEPPYRMGNGIGIWVDANDIIVRYNKVSQCYDAGISPQGGNTYTQSNISIYYNTITNCWYSYELFTYSGATLTNVNFDNNTCTNAGSQWSANQRPDLNNARHIINWESGGIITNCNVRNNIFYVSANTSYRTDSQSTVLKFNNNLYYVNVMGIVGSQTYTTLSQWQTGTSQDGNSKSGNPNFISTTDYHLLSSSPAINGGINIGLTQDIDGNPIIGNPDMGAYESNYPPIAQTEFYIAPNGNDATGDGTITKPWFTLNKGWSAMQAGYTLYVRGGTYQYGAEQYLTNKSGVADNYIKVWAYQNEKPVINPSATYTGNVGITVEEVSYVHIKGLDVSQYTQRTSDDWYNGIIAADANYCIFELLNVHHNGFGMSLGRWTTGNPVTGNLFLNCDFHHNYDPITAIGDNFPYGGSDGLTIRVDNPNSTNTVRGCRFWNNSDDGFDGWYNAGFLLFDNCWSFNNGYREDGITQGGDGNGIKLGPLVAQPWTGYETQHKRTVQNCVAFNNRMNGFDQNQARCIMYFYNNTSFGNGNHGFLLNNENAIVMIARNNISYKNKSGQAYFNSVSILDHNTFTYNNGVNPSYSVTDADFVSLVATGTDGARYPDGSLPTITFLQLANGSDLIKRGVDVGLPYTGIAPDLGAFDYLIKPTGNKSTMNKGKRIVRQGTPIKN